MAQESQPGWTVGEEVAFFGPFERIPTIARIARITPTGQLRLKCGRKFNSDRWEMGATSYSRTHVEKLTDGHRAAVYRDNIIGRIEKVNWRQLPTEAIESALAIVRAERNKQSQADLSKATP